MQGLIKQTAEDITNCANSCDAYAKTFLMSKVLFSESWSAEFKKYMGCFTTRRGDFAFALSIHTGQAVNDVTDKLGTANDKLDTANDKLDIANDNVALVNQKYVQLSLS